MIENIKIGQKVYYNMPYNDINAGIVRAIHPRGMEDRVEVIGTENTRGTQSVKIENCYKTKEDLMAGLKEAHDKLVQEYCESIQTVEDLVRFCYNHNMSGEEYTEYEAKEAANIKAEELLGITLDESMLTKDDDFVAAVNALDRELYGEHNYDL